MAVVSTGFFDGVHLGHRLVIDTLLSVAKERGEQSMIVTFWPHPRTVLQNDARNLRLLSSLPEKKERLLSLGIDRVEVLDFSREFSGMTAHDYLKEILQKQYGTTAIVMGYDNRMGSDSLGRQAVEELALSLGLEVVSVQPKFIGASGLANTPDIIAPDLPISSTKIRAALEAGDVVAASAMLGYDYCLHGVVVAGNRVGRTRGFPTANMQLYEPLKLVPANGVYLVEVEIFGSKYYGMTNIGVRPTVTGGGSRTIETHIFDFDELIYGLDIRIRFLERIRDEKRFDSLQELVEQLRKDKMTCQKRSRARSEMK